MEKRATVRRGQSPGTAVAAPAPSEDADTKEPSATRPKYRLTVSTKDKDAWVLIVIDETKVRDMFVRAGQTVVMRGNKSFVFTTGNAGAVNLAVNGKPIKFDVPKSGVLRNWEIPLP